MSYSSYNAYIVQTNGATLLGILVANYLVFTANIPLLTYLLSYRLVIVTESLLAILCISNIWRASRTVVKPLVDIDYPLKQYAFKRGPLLNSLGKIYQFFKSEWNTPKKPAKSTNSTDPATSTKPKNPTDVSDVASLSSLFANSTCSLPPARKVILTQPNHDPLAPNYSLKSVFGNNQQEGISREQVAKAALNFYNQDTYNTQPTLGFTAPNASNSAAPGTSASNAKTTESTIPKLKYVPCIRPPLKPTADRERLLWFLSPTTEVVEDFRIQQMIDFQKNWNRFNDRASRVYYDRMTDALVERIFKPLSESIEIYNQLLIGNGSTVASCPGSTILLSMMMPNTTNAAFNLQEVENYINLEGHRTVEGRQYVVDRIKELASSKRMAAFHFTPIQAGMPTDTTIIMHIFTLYLSTKERYAIPPLVPVEGDVFKFLLIYILITPELERWNIFDL